MLRLAETRTAPISRSTPWVETRPNRYTADQSPCWERWENYLSKGILRALELFLASQGLAEANRVGQGVHHCLLPCASSPPSSHKVWHCSGETSRHLGDLLDVSLALEENIVPEYLIEQNLRELFFVSYRENICLELFILFVYLGID